MHFKAKKSYGHYKTSSCPFCGNLAIHKNKQGLEVCRNHLDQNLEEFRCICGSWIEARAGKFGSYFHCLNCGNINYKKGLEIKALTSTLNLTSNSSAVKAINQCRNEKENKNKKENELKEEIKIKKEDGIRKEIEIKKEKKEITITTDDLDYFD